MEKGNPHGITFYNSRERGSLYRHTTHSKQQMDKFLEKSASSNNFTRLDTAKASVSDKPLIGAPSFDVTTARSKPIKPFVSSPANVDEFSIPINFVTNTTTTPRMFPQLTPHITEFNAESPKFSRHRKYPSAGSNPLHLNIPKKFSSEFPETPSTDPNRQLLSTPGQTDRFSSRAKTPANFSRGSTALISDTKLDVFRITKFASQFKDLHRNSNPAYELTMPRDSARRKNMIDKMSHDISHLVDLKGEAATKQDLIKFVERLQKENKEFTPKDGLKAASFSPAVKAQLNNNPDDLRNLFSQNLFDITLRKASEFLAQSISTPKRSEFHAALTTDIRNNSRGFKMNTDRPFTDALATGSNSPFSTRQVESRETRHNTFGAAIVTESNEENGKFTYKQLLESLKLKLPNAFTGAPSGRTEVALLHKWLNSTVESVKDDSTLSLTEKLHRTDDIYNIAFKEVVRQVSCECLERGEILMKLWKNYMKLYNGLVSDVKSHFNEKIKEYHEEFNRIKDGFHVELKRKDQEIEAMAKVRHELELRCEVIAREKMEIELKHSHFEGATGKLKNQIRTMQKQFKILKQEYEDTTYKYNKLRNEMHLGGEDDFLDPEEILRAKFLEMQNNSGKQPDNVLNTEADEPEDTPTKQQNANLRASGLSGFGAFVAKKLEYADKETETEVAAFHEIETQTDLVLVHPQYDELFCDMKTIEEIRKEEALKREIQEENVQNLEEDLHAEIIEQNLHGLLLSDLKPQEEHVYLSEDVLESHNNISIYSESNSMYLDSENTKRRSGRRTNTGSMVRPTATEDVRKTNSEAAFTLKDLDEEGHRNATSLEGGALEGSDFDSSKNSKDKGIRIVDQHQVNHDEDDDEVMSLGSQSKAKDLQLDIPRRTQPKIAESRFKGTPSKIMLQIPKSERELHSPIQENMDESLISPKTPITSKKDIADPAHQIQERISKKMRALEGQRVPSKADLNDPGKFSIHRLQTHVRQIFDEEDSQHHKQTEGPESQQIEDAEKNPSGLNKGKYFENMVMHQIKYIRLMKMLKVEKAKAEELEQRQQAQDEQLLEKLKEVVEEIQAGANDALDKEKLLNVVKDLQERKKPIEELRDTNFSKAHDGVPSPLFTGRSDARSKTYNMISAPIRSEARLLTSKVLEDDGSAEKKNQNFVRKRTDQKLTMFKANFAVSTTALSTHTLGQSTTNIGAMLGKKREPSTAVKKHNAVLETVHKLEKILKKGVRLRNLVTLKKILKSITSFLVDKIAAAHESPAVKEQDMATFIYTSFFNTYGTSKFTESKYLKFMASVKAYTAIHRIATFARLCGVSDAENNWTLDESKQFLIGLEFLLTQRNIGMTIANSEIEKRHYTPFIRAVEYARQFCERRGIHSEFVDLKRELEKLKETDSTGQNRAGKIKVDLFLEMIVDLYRKYKIRSKEYLRWVFEACNFLGRKTLGLDELAVLIKYIEPEKYDPKRIEEIYNLNEEYVNSENVGIPFEKFVVAALENELFSIEKQRKFVQAADDNEVAKNFKSIKEEWSKKRERLEQVLEYNQRMHEPEILTFWTVALGALDGQMCSEAPENKLCLLMKYRILVLEMNSTFTANIPVV